MDARARRDLIVGPLVMIAGALILGATVVASPYPLSDLLPMIVTFGIIGFAGAALLTALTSK